MAQEIVTWCDVCDEAQPQRGALVAVTVDGVRQALDLCGRHEGELLDALREALDKWGHPVEPPRAKRQAFDVDKRSAPRGSGSKPLKCFFCGVGYVSMATMRSHLAGAHGCQVKDVADLYGALCPLCGKEYASLGMHGRSHGIDGGAPQLFAVAEEEGDPLGIVAAQRKAITRGN